jgi:TetR/AcrR family transcriptional regulator, transcriptional repressor for nem operon
MPRTRSFDETEVVERAMELFWTNGYDATSVPDLTEHLGVFPGSLYRTFGDKHRLYLRAIEHYRDTQSRRLAPLLVQEGPVLPRIRAVMVGYLEIAAQEREPRGCLIANASGERLPRDRAVAALLADVLAVVEDGFLQGLREADRRGELRAGLDLPAHAAMLTMLLEGLQVVAKSEPDPMRLVRAVDATLAGLVGDERAAAGS